MNIISIIKKINEGRNTPKKTHQTFVFVTALTLFIPAIFSAWTQPFPVTIIIFLASTWSSLYHYSQEKQFQELDVIWANITSLFTGLMLILVAMQYGFFSKEVIYPLLIAILAFGIYIEKASVQPGQSTDTVPNYDLWHGIWHCLTSLTALLLVYHKTNYNYVLKPFSFLVKERMKIPSGILNPKAFLK
jgi:hypothetical protein